MKITGADIIAAMEKNGYPLAKKIFFRDKKGNYLPSGVTTPERVGAACIWGQAAINLNIQAGILYGQAMYFLDDVAKNIANYNDLPETTYEQILAYAKKVMAPYMNTEI